MDYVISFFKEDDATEIKQLIHRAMLETNIQDYSLESLKEDMKAIDEAMLIHRASFTHFYVFRDGSKIIGTGAIGPYWDSLTESSLFTIFVLPEYQGKGLGRLIIETLEQDEFYMRARRVEVPASITAVNFYKKFGYEVKPGVTGPDEEGIIRMEKYR
ncbi:GNAT family N-acetyltransferase [Macrococcoides caseolyticum]|uniref:GNAT family N-acetyltransferase n=1 Tax=Macrococcoides caseolyticum TaxID=69966 RepID=UPI001F483B52|nr:GNAT family N-acetyltransferase [Macrococcus caseolyticus]MCE4956428.1 GNAT family N-acetyltransferase [Macrococcus caseolyticus]